VPDASYLTARFSMSLAFFQRFIALTPLTLFIGMSSINLRKKSPLE
jgi:hypothetical protein